MNSFDNIPQEMKELPQWVARVDKIPINPNSLYGAKSTDKTSWGTFEQAKAAIGKKAKMKAVQGKECNGIGFVLSAPYCGIDIDHCFNPETGRFRTTCCWPWKECRKECSRQGTSTWKNVPETYGSSSPDMAK